MTTSSRWRRRSIDISKPPSGIRDPGSAVGSAFRRTFVLPARHQSVRHRKAGGTGLWRASAAADSARRRARGDAASADARKAVGRAGCRPGAIEGRHAQGAGGTHRGERHIGRGPRSAAGDHVLAGRRWAVHHTAAGLHDASRQAGPQPRHVPDAGVRRPHDGHALADRQGWRLSLRRRGSARRDAAGHGVSRRPAGVDAVGHRAAARERAGADARVADCRRAPCAGARLRTASAHRQRGVRAPGHRAAAGPQA